MKSKKTTSLTVLPSLAGIRKRILFLDFDGVLNSSEYFERVGPIEIGPNHVDPERVKGLNRLVREADCDIVISSSWRHYFDIPQLQEILKARGFDYSDRILGETPARLSNHWRGNEIQMWLDDNFGTRRKKRPAFVILDDNSDMVHLKPFLIQTSFVKGLTEADIDAAIALFEEQPKPLRWDKETACYVTKDGKYVLP